MINSLSRLVFLVYLFNLCSGSFNDEDSDYMKREHSLIKPYQGAGMVMPYWDFTGSTVITENHIRLTPDQQSKRGALWNTVPCQVRNWELVVHFRIHGKAQELFGDGMAIWYVRNIMELGKVFGNRDFHEGLGVLIDTYSNHNGPHAHQHPYISAMVNNGTLEYDHDRDGTHTQLAGCEAKVRNLEQPTYISIRYEGDTLTVSTDVENKAEWKQCLSVKGIRLPTGYHFGITAATGDLSDAHDVLSVRLYEIDKPVDDKDEDRSKIVPSAAFFEPPRDHVDDPKPSSLSGIKVFLLVLIGIIALVACVVIGIMFYQKQQEHTRKRFY